MLGLKALYERKRRALLRRPSFGRMHAQAHARLADGLLCEVEEAAWRTRVDQSVEEGGSESAPQPWQMMRASIAASLAMGYRQWGARLDVAIDGVEVDVICESDTRGQLGIEGVAVGWQRMVVVVLIASAVPEADVRRVIETADRLNPLLANLSPAIERVHHLRLVRPAV
ncbi:MAG TPA: OsmC family protein [Polyangia bacterium]|nr:OsmC family protein [Polyangia bacterium]